MTRLFYGLLNSDLSLIGTNKMFSLINVTLTAVHGHQKPVFLEVQCIGKVRLCRAFSALLLGQNFCPIPNRK